MNDVMRGTILLVLTAAWPLAGNAAGQLPPFLTGSWGTAESLHAGSTGQSELHLQADGLGVMGGSSAPSANSGPGTGKPDARAIIGFPVQTSFEGAVLTVRLFLPPGMSNAQLEGVRFACRYEPAGPTLACTDPEGVTSIMRRRSSTVPTEASAVIDAVQRQIAAASR